MQSQSYYPGAIPLSLYLHFPWCVRKCPYCDFNSHTHRDGNIPFTDWHNAVLADLDAACPQIENRSIHSLYIGGGTPSLLPPAILARLLDGLRERLPIAPDTEITLEANPGTTDAARFHAFAKAGITRLSLGIQSFDDALLQRIGRIHSGRAAHEALEAALGCFEKVNIDLMTGLPGQTDAQAQADLETAIASGVRHLSCYSLTLEPNTPFAQAPPELPDEDQAADMQDSAESRLIAAGFEHYEVSAFARAGHECRHNLNYWQFGDYLGLGPGAHGKLTTPNGILREVRHKHPSRYLEGAARGDFIQLRHQVGPEELPFEFMMNALRLPEGVPAALLTERTGLQPESIAAQLDGARRAGLLDTSPDVYRATHQGLRFLNNLLQIFLPER
ncbi:MAG: radical SAM family heme chaperone HemW [Azoarcus sp.]|jgi:oxygen-independent coproporphyrinogen-3 oxidase|nr:radical SAM family heme chaperone HemW [Azoarcus sp.]